MYYERKMFHDWNFAQKETLIAKAYRALPAGVAFIAIDNIIDDERKNSFDLMFLKSTLAH